MIRINSNPLERVVFWSDKVGTFIASYLIKN